MMSCQLEITARVWQDIPAKLHSMKDGQFFMEWKARTDPFCGRGCQASLQTALVGVAVADLTMIEALP